MQEIIANLDFEHVSYIRMAQVAEALAVAVDCRTEINEGEAVDEALLHIRVNDLKSGRGEDFWFR